MVEFADPQGILDKIDWEGWPAALEWFAGDSYEDAELQELIDKAVDAYSVLENLHMKIEKRVEELTDG